MPAHGAGGPTISGTARFAGSVLPPVGSPAARSDGGREAGGSPGYGVRVLASGETYASLLPNVSWSGPTPLGPCQSPTSNGTPANPVRARSAVPLLVCLNAVNESRVTSTWQANLTSPTTFVNGSSEIVGCPPIPDQTNCGFFASNTNTTYLTQWVGDTPTSTDTLWAPNETGYAPSDIVFYATIEFNASIVPGTVYSVTVALPGATPAPVTYYLEPEIANWNGSATATLLFDMTAAWLTQYDGLAGAYAGVGDYSIAVAGHGCAPCYASFVETGLPLHTDWSISLDDRSYSSPGRSIVVPLAAGTYPFAVGAVPGYTPRPLEGSVTVGSPTDGQPIRFRPAYFVSLYVAGLPPHDGWTFTLLAPLPGAVAGLHCRNHCDGLVGGWATANGSFPYFENGPAGFVLSNLPPEGSYRIEGANLTLTFDFLRGSTARIAFVESGLPMGVPWCVSFGEIDCTTSRTMARAAPFPLRFLNLTPGSYPYSIATRDGSLTVSAQVRSLPIPVNGTLPVGRSETVRVFFRYYASVTFTEIGLATGTWSVRIRGVTETAPVGSPIVFDLTNGSYSYRVGSESGHRLLTLARSFEVRGAPLVVRVYFATSGAPAAVPPPDVTLARTASE